MRVKDKIFVEIDFIYTFVLTKSVENHSFCQ